MIDNNKIKVKDESNKSDLENNKRKRKCHFYNIFEAICMIIEYFFYPK